MSATFSKAGSVDESGKATIPAIISDDLWTHLSHDETLCEISTVFANNFLLNTIFEVFYDVPNLVVSSSNWAEFGIDL